MDRGPKPGRSWEYHGDMLYRYHEKLDLQKMWLQMLYRYHEKLDLQNVVANVGDIMKNWIFKMWLQMLGIS